jgi:hypothetical protein
VTRLWDQETRRIAKFLNKLARARAARVALLVQFRCPHGRHIVGARHSIPSKEER